MSPQTKRQINGLSLMELMVVVAIIALLSTIGWSQYRDQFNRGVRGDAVTALTRASAQMEKCYGKVVPNAYTDCTLSNMGNGPCSDKQLKPKDTSIYSPRCRWKLSIDQQSSNAYTLSASRTYQGDDGSSKSETLTLDSLGRKTGPWPQ